MIINFLMNQLIYGFANFMVHFCREIWASPLRSFPRASVIIINFESYRGICTHLYMTNLSILPIMIYDKGKYSNWGKVRMIKIYVCLEIYIITSIIPRVYSIIFV